MALSLSKIFGISLLLLWTGIANALPPKVYNFTANWVHRNPDHAFNRRTMALNGQWPIPHIEVTKGQRLIVHLHNDLGDQDVSLHFHGLYLKGANEMDGPVGVTQCGVPPGKSITYNFVVDQPGTYWYHSHVRGQYPDGIRGPLIVHDDDNPYKNDFDEEVVLPISDWYHEQMPKLLSEFINVANPTGAEPVPNSALMNETQNGHFQMVPGRKYFFRIINMAAFAAQYLWFEGHTMKIIEVDGIYTEMQPAQMLYIAAAQRYGVIVEALNSTNKNFNIVGSMDEDLFDTVPEGLNPNVTLSLVYNENNAMPKPMDAHAFDFYDDYNLIPYDREPILEPVSQTITMTMEMGNLGDGANYAFINGVTYVSPKVPTLYTVMSTNATAMDKRIYGVNSNAFVLGHNEVIEIQFNNNDPGKHPFHLHGHAFQAVYRSPDNAKSYDAKANPPSTFKKIPMKRDTLLVHPNGNFVIRFRSDNPGVWMYHCHLEWHIDSGLVATIIEAPLEMQKTLSIPEEHYQLCRDQDLPISGNAAGNTEDLFNLDGANVSVPPLPAGFTARGIVALVFSCISAFLGMAMIGWYGIKPIGQAEFTSAKDRIAEAGI